MTTNWKSIAVLLLKLALLLCVLVPTLGALAIAFARIAPGAFDSTLLTAIGLIIASTVIAIFFAIPVAYAMASSSPTSQLRLCGFCICVYIIFPALINTSTTQLFQIQFSAWVMLLSLIAQLLPVVIIALIVSINSTDRNLIELSVFSRVPVLFFIYRYFITLHSPALWLAIPLALAPTTLIQMANLDHSQYFLLQSGFSLPLVFWMFRYARLVR